MNSERPQTRIQQKKQAAILNAALDVFSTHGYAGATLAQIAEAADLSKPNLLYYFPSKEAIYIALIEGLMGSWLDPLKALDPNGDPVEEIVAYVLRKLDMARNLPRESRIFANEILQGAPRILALIQGPVRSLVDEKAALIERWSADGRLAPVDGRHLIFSIWATTQHYADFDVQVQEVLGPDTNRNFQDAAQFLDGFFRRALTPG